MNEQWEYKIIHIGPAETEITENFDRYGVEGWELVSTAVIVREDDYGGMLAFFKRRLES